MVRFGPKHSISQILKWADAHYKRTGRWPEHRLGALKDAKHETWLAIDKSLRVGTRGLPGGSSLARLLAAERGVRNIGDLSPLTLDHILAWADAHHRRTGQWPKQHTQPGPAPGEGWNAIYWSLYSGNRGLPGGSSLVRLLEKHRGVPFVRQGPSRPALSIPQILVWADAHHRKTGDWPTTNSGLIRGSERDR